MVVALTGTLNAVVEPSRPSDLSTGYGQAILVKIVILLVMGGLGHTHQASPTRRDSWDTPAEMGPDQRVSECPSEERLAAGQLGIHDVAQEVDGLHDPPVA